MLNRLLLSLLVIALTPAFARADISYHPPPPHWANCLKRVPPEDILLTGFALSAAAGLLGVGLGRRAGPSGRAWLIACGSAAICLGLLGVALFCRNIPNMGHAYYPDSVGSEFSPRSLKELPLPEQRQLQVTSGPEVMLVLTRQSALSVIGTMSLLTALLLPWRIAKGKRLLVGAWLGCCNLPILAVLASALQTPCEMVALGGFLGAGDGPVIRHDGDGYYIAAALVAVTVMDIGWYWAACGSGRRPLTDDLLASELLCVGLINLLTFTCIGMGSCCMPMGF